MAQTLDTQPGAETRAQRMAPGAGSPVYRWVVGLMVVTVVIAASVWIWGPGMGFPTTVSSRDVGAVTLERSVRDVTGSVIDDSVGWMTREGSWIFDGLSTVITYALIYIEGVLKWLPWPAVVVGLALLSFVVGRWSLMVFTSLALLFVGFMDLWKNMMDTVALMTVAVTAAVSIGLPLGVLAARNRTGGLPDASLLGRDADHAQLRLSAAGDSLSSDWGSRRASLPPSYTRSRRRYG